MMVDFTSKGSVVAIQTCTNVHLGIQVWKYSRGGLLSYKGGALSSVIRIIAVPFPMHSSRLTVTHGARWMSHLSHLVPMTHPQR